MIMLIQFKIECLCGDVKIFEIHYPKGPIPEFIYLDMIDYGQNFFGWKYFVDDSWKCCKCLHLSNNNSE